jgi:hypothetical protein
MVGDIVPCTVMPVLATVEGEFVHQANLITHR